MKNIQLMFIQLTLLDILGLDILSLDILGLDILSLDILGIIHFKCSCSCHISHPSSKVETNGVRTNTVVQCC